MEHVNIDIFEKNETRRGELFERLMMDLLLTLGYDDCRTRLRRVGRELDIEGRHRTEQRLCIAECKATRDPVGGADLNKFAGALELEVQRAPAGFSTQGYFISLGGFRQTAIDQENEAHQPRFAMLGPEEIVKSLVKGRIVPSFEVAIERAARLCEAHGINANVKNDRLLIGSHLGWSWAIRLASELGEDYVVLIHADGRAVSHRQAVELITKAGDEAGVLEGSTILPPLQKANLPSALNAVSAYADYLEKHFSTMEIDVLNMQGDYEPVVVPIEQMYVPLQVGRLPKANPKRPEPFELGEETSELVKVMSIDDALRTTPRMSILGPPGSGKSTVAAQVAIAGLRHYMADEQDARPLPILLRCRDLRLFRGSQFEDVLRQATSRYAPRGFASDELLEVFLTRIRRNQAILILDGLDEMPYDSERALLTDELRTFLAHYPSVSCLITSRFAGYRIVAKSLATVCVNYMLMGLTSEQIVDYVHNWYQHFPRSVQNIDTARHLARRITSDETLLPMATNPLLLETLLMVHHQTGEIPRNRPAIYHQALVVLLHKWNPQGHEPIDFDAAIPRLSYLAYSMQSTFMYQVPKLELQRLWGGPDRLGHTPWNRSALPSDFDLVKRIEARSSIIIQTGLRLHSGNLQPVYEFRHRAFLEYLAGFAIAHRIYGEGGRRETARVAVDSRNFPMRHQIVGDSRTIAGWNSPLAASSLSGIEREVLDELATEIVPRVDQASWHEALSLALVLSGRIGALLVDYLLSQAATSTTSIRGWSPDKLAVILGKAVLDGLELPDDLLFAAILFVVLRRSEDPEVRLMWWRPGKISQFFEEAYRVIVPISGR